MKRQNIKFWFRGPKLLTLTDDEVIQISDSYLAIFDASEGLDAHHEQLPDTHTKHPNVT